MDVREKLVELLKEIVAIQECGFGDPRPTYETVASYLMSHGVTVQDNTQITDELLEQLRNAPITVMTEEPTIEVVQGWISVKDRLPDKSGEYIILNDAGHQDVLRYSEKYKLFNACDFFEEDFVIKHSIKVTHWMPLLEMPKGE